MVTLEATARRHDGVTLVEATLANDGPDPRLVRVESELDGPVWPPRREGVPAAGWDPEAGTLAVALSPDERVGVGFATPAEPVDPPVSVVEDRPAPDEDGGIGDSPAAVVRALGDPSPPGDALSTARPGSDPVAAGVDRTPAGGGTTGDPAGGDGGDRECESGDPERGDADGDDGDPERRPTGRSGDDTSNGGDGRDDGPADRAGRPRGNGADRGDDRRTRPGGYPAVAAWLDAVERRVDRSEGSETGSGRPARRALAADAERLRAVGERAVELAERAGELVDAAGGRPPREGSR